MLQLVFFLQKASEAAVKTATSVAPAAKARWKPCRRENRVQISSMHFWDYMNMLCRFEQGAG